MSISEIIGIAIAVTMLIFVILTWAGITPKKLSENHEVRRLVDIDALDIGTLNYWAFFLSLNN
jgi:hypothetical protein